MPIERSIALINKAKYENERDKAWDIWVRQVAFMSKENYQSFEEYWLKINKKIDQRPKEDIIARVQEIREKAKK